MNNFCNIDIAMLIYARALHSPFSFAEGQLSSSSCILLISSILYVVVSSINTVFKQVKPVMLAQ